MWRYREFLPFEGEPVASLDTGFTPLIDAPRLADKLGVARVWVKNDAVRRIRRCRSRTASCRRRSTRRSRSGSTRGRLDGQPRERGGAHAARAGLASWIFIPEDLEIGKVIGTAVYGPNLVRIKGYDDVNRLCAQLADRSAGDRQREPARLLRRRLEDDGVRDRRALGWRLPSAIVAPMAGGSLVTKLGKGFKEFIDAGS